MSHPYLTCVSVAMTHVKYETDLTNCFSILKISITPSENDEQTFSTPTPLQSGSLRPIDVPSYAPRNEVIMPPATRLGGGGGGGGAYWTHPVCLSVRLSVRVTFVSAL